VASRFYRWRKAGLFPRLFDTLQQQADTTGQLDWHMHFIDSPIVRAHQHAAGAQKGMPTPKRWGVAKEASARKSTSVPRVQASS
jgi:transposase